MRNAIAKKLSYFAVTILLSAGTSAAATDPIASNVAAKSPWGPTDEIGTLNMMSDESRLEVLQRVESGEIYDLSVDLFVGMPTCCSAFGDPSYQIWMTHSPSRGDGELLSHSSEAVSMNTHTGTHIDALNHFGLHGKIWNQVRAEDALETRGWTKAGADTLPPILARGVLIDVAKSKDMNRLPASYAITPDDLQEALRQQDLTIRPGDVVLIRTGQMRLWPDASKFTLFQQAGLGLAAAQWLAEDQQAMLLGADNLGLESFPSKNPENFAPVHSYLLAEKGVSIMEVMWLEDLAADHVYEFLFIATPLKLRGATGSPIRPLAIPLQAKNWHANRTFAIPPQGRGRRKTVPSPRGG